jgi:hypothetical protein
MHPPPMYPQLPHLHNHGLAMLVCIIPLWNMRPLPVPWSHLKRSFWRSNFLLKYHQNPQVVKRRSKKRGRERKPPRVSSNKGEVNILRGERHFNFKISFSMWSHFLPLHHTISKKLSKIIEKVFLTLFGPSFSLAIYMTWVVPFTHELHIFRF